MVAPHGIEPRLFAVKGRRFNLINLQRHAQQVLRLLLEDGGFIPFRLIGKPCDGTSTIKPIHFKKLLHLLVRGGVVPRYRVNKCLRSLEPYTYLRSTRIANLINFQCAREEVGGNSTLPFVIVNVILCYTPTLILSSLCSSRDTVFCKSYSSYEVRLA